MGHWRWIVALWALTVLVAPREGEAQTEVEDEKRPYKFAFSIEGYQHRSEEKDEKGIIMGEFGFVTGDGVYHVTVYATDENGDFKILKMKNYYVGLPGEGTTVPPSRAPPQTTAPPPSKPTTTPSPIIKHLQGLMGCSGCIVPDKSMGGPLSESGEGLIDERFGGRPGIPGTTGGSPGYSGSPGAAGGGVGKPGSSSKSGYQTEKPAYNEKSQGGTQRIGGSHAGFGGGSGGGTFLNTGSPSPPGSQIGQGQAGQFQQPPGSPSPSRAGPSQTGASPGVPEGGTGPPPGGSGSPSPAAPGRPIGGSGSPDPTGPGRPIGDSGSPIPTVPGSPTGGPVGQYSKSTAPPGSTGPGQPSRSPGQVSEGLPPGVSLGDMMDLLYKFNYTLKYHGHNEKGYKGGEKEGGYFFNGRDGLGRNVEYIANEFGFQPNITLVDLGLAAPDTPKEPEEPNELRGNEFKWYYTKR